MVDRQLEEDIEVNIQELNQVDIEAAVNEIRQWPSSYGGLTLQVDQVDIEALDELWDRIHGDSNQ